jgi:hypothetical protein
MNRLNIIQKLINRINAQSYLEIGVNTGYILNSINIPFKIGVDPDPQSKATLFITSDEFFANNKHTFDIIFIDGLHHAEQVEKDITNSVKILNNNGYIICHDMLPSNKIMQQVPRLQSEWTGDCWKAWVKIRSYRNDLIMFVVDTDYGCGIIQKGSQNTIDITNIDLTYENFVMNKNNWMNIQNINVL